MDRVKSLLVEGQGNLLQLMAAYIDLNNSLFQLCDRLWLPIVGLGAHAAHAEAVDHEDFAGVRLLPRLVDAGGYKQSIEVRATKSAGCRFDTGKVDCTDLFAGVWIEANDTATMAKGDPQVAVGIDCHAVGRTVVAVCCGINRDCGIVDHAVEIVVIVATDLSRCGVDVIHLRGCLIPADTVGVGHVINLQMECTLRIQHVERGVASLFDEADGAGPEATSGITFAVVEAIGRTLFRLRIGEGLLSSADWIEGSDARVTGIYKAAACTRDDAADTFTDIPDLLVVAVWI